MLLPLNTTGAGGATLSTQSLDTTLASPLWPVKLCIVAHSSRRRYLGGLCLACAARMAWARASSSVAAPPRATWTLCFLRFEQRFEQSALSRLRGWLCSC
jgi:hypothetical protein